MFFYFRSLPTRPITGLKNNAAVSGISLNGNVVTLSNSVLNQGTVTVSNGYTLKLADDVPKSTVTNAAWSVSGTTATYKANATSAGYSLSSDGKTINYTNASGGNTVTITGLKNGLSVTNGNIEGISLKDNVVMVSSTIIGNGEVKITGNGYTLEIVEDMPIPDGVTVQKDVLTVTNKFADDIINLNEKWATGVTKANTSAISRNLSVVGNSANNSIKSGNGSDTISAGLGNDTLTGGNGKDIFIYEGGNDVITDYKPNEDKIKLNLSEVKSSSVKGSDVILTTSNGTLTVKATKDKVITFVDDNGDTEEKIFFANYSYAPLVNGLTYDAKRAVLTASNKFKDDEIDLSEYLPTVTKLNASAVNQALNIVGNDSAISIKGGKGADTLNGGTGNDTLTGGTGNDVFIYEGGNDVITDYKVGEDKIKISAITSSTVKGSDVILTTSNGTLTVKATKDKAITFVDDNGATTEKIFFANYSYDPLVNGLTYDAKRAVLTASNKFKGDEIDLSEYLPTVTKVNASAVSQALNIVGNDSDNSIKAGKSDDTIYGGDGKNTIFGGTGNDSIYGGNDNDKLQGDAGNDTLNGGLGNNTLTGGAGNDAFIYEGGNDVITDYTAGQDSIKVSDTISKVSYSGKNVIFTIGSGSLTVNNAKGKDISVIDSSNKTQTYSRTLEILYDDNFMTDEFEIDEISEVTETNYSVGKFENTKDNAQICSIDSIASASYADEK